MKNSPFKFIINFLLLAVFVLTSAQFVKAQKMDGIARGRAKAMLKNIKNAIKDNYYDPNFGGMDIDARFDAAEEKLKNAETLGQAFSIIAQAVVDLNDSHTRFNPPARNAIVDYGWRMKMFGDKCYITRVKEKSDAEKKGLKVGDEVLAVNNFPPSKSEIWKMIYYYQQLNPQTKLNLMVKSPNQEPRRIEVESKITHLKTKINFNDSIDFNEAAREGEKVYSSYKHHFKTIGNTVVWKMPSFGFDPGEVESLVSNFRNKQALILDLRNNPGGYVVTLEKLVGYFFDKDIKIADLKGRKKMDPQEAKSEGNKVFNGKLIVLVDGNSASAAEIFARLMQIEKRGTVLGDVSAGAVMQSLYYGMDAGVDTVISYGASITNADVIMSDGKSLERVGVTPDEIILPTGQDLAARRDPVMARAFEILGTQMSSDEAGKIFPEEKEIERKTNFSILLREF